MTTACYDLPSPPRLAGPRPAEGRGGGRPWGPVAMSEIAHGNIAGSDEAQWIDRAVDGETGAFEELYRRHVGRIYALCLRMCGDAREAEELTQDAFVRAWEKLDSFGGRSAFSSWLHRLTVNVVLGRWRARGRRRDRVVAFDEVAGGGEAALAPAMAPAAAAVDLERAIAALPAGARTVFVLYDVEGHSHREIAEMTGLAVGTCKAQLHRARQLLRKALGS